MKMKFPLPEITIFVFTLLLLSACGGGEQQKTSLGTNGGDPVGGSDTGVDLTVNGSAFSAHAGDGVIALLSKDADNSDIRRQSATVGNDGTFTLNMTGVLEVGQSYTLYYYIDAAASGTVGTCDGADYQATINIPAVAAAVVASETYNGASQQDVCTSWLSRITYEDVGSIFSANCAKSGCHSGSTPSGTMDLSGSWWLNVVSVASSQRPDLFRIAPNDTVNSYLIQKLEGGNGIIGNRMPATAAPLSAADMDVIKTWVNKGALTP